MGVRNYRWDVNQSCSGAFTYQGTWLGTDSDRGWVEGGTDRCTYSNSLTWIWGECYSKGDPEGCYYYDQLWYAYGVSVDDHVWTIWRDTTWHIYRVAIDATEIHQSGMTNWCCSVSTDVGLEVHVNQPNGYIQGYYMMNLQYIDDSLTPVPWSGQDGCHSDNPRATGHWDSPTEFHAGFNAGVSDGCP